MARVVLATADATAAVGSVAVGSVAHSHDISVM